MSFSTNVYADDYGFKVKEISDNIIGGAETFDEKIRAIRKFLHRKSSGNNIKPDGTPVVPQDIYSLRRENGYLDLVKWLGSGYGAWCDQLADFFLQLASVQGIDSRIVFLVVRRGMVLKSPHTIVEALSPDGRWVVVEPLYDIEFINKDGKLATRADIRKDTRILYENPRVKALAKKKPNLWTNKKYLSMYYNKLAERDTRKKAGFDVTRVE